jgi:hypothetical protein
MDPATYVISGSFTSAQPLHIHHFFHLLLREDCVSSAFLWMKLVTLISLDLPPTTAGFLCSVEMTFSVH